MWQVHENGVKRISSARKRHISYPFSITFSHIDQIRPSSDVGNKLQKLTDSARIFRPRECHKLCAVRPKPVLLVNVSGPGQHTCKTVPVTPDLQPHLLFCLWFCRSRRHLPHVRQHLQKTDHSGQ